MLFSWSLWCVASSIFHLVASHQPEETSPLAVTTVVKHWSAPRNAASGLATEGTQSHNSNQAKRKISAVQPDVVSRKVPKIDNSYGIEHLISTFLTFRPPPNTLFNGSPTRSDARDGPFHAFPPAESHQPEETSVMVENPVQKIVDQWRRLLIDKPKLGLPICAPTAFRNIARSYGDHFIFVALVLDQCLPHGQPESPTLTYKTCESRRSRLRTSAEALYQSNDPSPYQTKAMEVIAQLSKTNDLKGQERWARNVLVKLARPLPKPKGIIESCGVKSWSEPSNEASGFATIVTQSRKRKATERKISQVKHDVVARQVPEIDYGHGQRSGQSSGTSSFLLNDLFPVEHSTDRDVGGTPSAIDEDGNYFTEPSL